MLFDLSSAGNGFVCICNTKGRVDELCAEIGMVTETGVLLSKAAQRLRGRMQFADSHAFGKCGRRCLRTLGDVFEGRRAKLDAKDFFFLRLFRELIIG